MEQANNTLTEESNSLSSSFADSAETGSSNSDSLKLQLTNWLIENVVWLLLPTMVSVAGIITSFTLFDRFLNLDQC